MYSYEGFYMFTQCFSSGILFLRIIIMLLLLLLSHVSCVQLYVTNRLLCPWDSPDKNTGVGCHFLLQCMRVKSEVAQSLSRVRLLATPWTAAYQASPPMGFSRQEYWSGGAIAFSVTSLYNYIKLFLR